MNAENKTQYIYLFVYLQRREIFTVSVLVNFGNFMLEILNTPFPLGLSSKRAECVDCGDITRCAVE